MTTVSRRRFVAVTAGATAGIVLGGRPARGAARTITVTSYGGRWEQAIRTHYVPLFKQQTGADVKVVVGAPTQWVSQIEAQPKNPPINVVDNSETLAFSLMEKGLTVKLSADRVPNLANIPEIFRKPWDGHAVMPMYTAVGLLYNHERIKRPPRSWREFFERTAVGEFGRNVSVPDITYPWAPHLLWLYARQSGGDVGNMDAAFATIRQIKPHVVKFWNNAVELEKMMSTREVDIALFLDGRSYALIESGAKFLSFQRPERDSLILGVATQVMKGPNEDLGLQWLHTLLDPRPQLEFFKVINFAVTNTQVSYPAALKDRVLPMSQVLIPPYRELARATPALVERWTKEIRGA